MKSEIKLVFKDFLMQPPGGVKFQMLIDGQVVDDNIVQKKDTPFTYSLVSDKEQTVITRDDAKKLPSIKNRKTHDVVIQIIGVSGTKKAVNQSTLTPGNLLTIVAVSPWVKVPLSNTGAVTQDMFYEVEYGVKRQNKTNTVKVVIQDLPRKILLEALSHRNSTVWAGDRSKKSLPHRTADESSKSVEFPANTHKCNLFVYDVLTAVGINVALIEHGKSKYIPGYSKVGPPLAGEWADENRLLKSWSVQRSPLPGDVGAYAVNYSDASGHVGFVLIQGVCISAGWEKIEVNDVGFRQRSGNAHASDHDFTIFRRYKYSTPQ
ncbi:CHAP domain-containing protein [Pseudomonas botevensis]|uniref:CHAP domain-containing protein n=1 Tax=Pseudomonas botevensis TaxID=2842352 RepID=UPI001C3C42FC|nr:CHAP domain-containing protein [Pseudomonas botevensis]MBV4473881.1 CHAP domain-containing protein [Pseudomonas botevensis]